MKTCPKCQRENQNYKSYCMDCYTDISTVIPDIPANYVRQMIKRIQDQIDKRVKKRVLLFIGFVVLFSVIALLLSKFLLGDDMRIAKAVPLFIPVLVVILFPYDNVYYKHNLKKKNIEKHISDTYLFLFRIIGFIGLALVYMRIVDVLGTINLLPKDFMMF